MAYITNANFRRITRELNTPDEKEFTFNDIVIWESPKGKVIDQKHPYIFGWWEANQLLTFKEFCKDANMAVSHFYRKIEKPQDSYRYIEPEKSPAYHRDENCEAMKSSLHQIKIPQEIWEQGKEKVIEYRTWWKDNEGLRNSNPATFVAKLKIVFGVDLKEYEVDVDRDNSGVYEMEDNRSVEEIDNNIRKLFNDLYVWAKEDRDRWNIFLNFKQNSFLCNKESIYTGLGNYSEDDIKGVLKIVHTKKLEIMEELKRLYQRRYIPDLQFQTSLLESLGFVPCYTCMGGVPDGHIPKEWIVRTL